MITTNEYIRNLDLQRDLLAAFSAMDYSITEGLSREEIQDFFARLLMRLSAICEVHEPGTARAFLEAIQAADCTDVLSTAFSFVEIGKQPTTESERVIVGRRELQQEILHFSRIVDLQDGSEALQNKRLRNSKLIPESLKVLCEFLTVARARVLQRGEAIAKPRSRPDRQMQVELGPAYMLVHDQEPSDYLLLLRGGDLPLRRDLAYLYASLLTYLTPGESLSALFIHVLETQPPGSGVAMALLEPACDGCFNLTRWSHWTGQQDGADRLEAWLGHLAERERIALGSGPVALMPSVAPAPTATCFTVDPRGITQLVLEVGGLQGGHCLHLAWLNRPLQSEEEIVRAAMTLAKARCQAPVTSIESGHVHLDRQLDGDQTLGAKIGYALFRHLAETQAIPPRLHPMVDDDHVLVQLAAKDYQAFFQASHPGAPFELIPESSPIIRAIACAMFSLISGNSSKAKHLAMQGGNLLLKVPEGNILCEVFEDFHGKCDNGCVFFEVALVIYRSDHATFSHAFHRYFGLEEDVHERVLHALDPIQPHDKIIHELRAYGARFESATNPHKSCRFFVELLETFLNRQDQVAVHVNVLEDYYEAQQFKVRKLLRYLNVPAQLWSLHFNGLTGRVQFERRAQPRPE